MNAERPVVRRDDIDRTLWHVTSYAAVREAESRREELSSSSSLGGIAPARSTIPMMIATDAPEHTAARRAIAPAFGRAPLMAYERDMREDARTILTSLPRNAPFDWMDSVANDLAARSLARTMGMPVASRNRLMGWGAAAAVLAEGRDASAMHQAMASLAGCAQWAETLLRRRRHEGERDLVGLLAGSATDARSFLGDLLLMLVAGSDTTRHTLGGAVVALNRQPDQAARLVQPDILARLPAETVRWQTPLAQMRRTATQDLSLDSVSIPSGARVALRYDLANRDPTVFENPDMFDLERTNAHMHLAFGHGVHRCAGARVAELQIRTLWETMIEMRVHPVLVGTPRRTDTIFVNGWLSVPVELRTLTRI